MMKTGPRLHATACPIPPPRRPLCACQAAGELRKRLKNLLGEDRALQITAGTFHSVAGRILRRGICNLPGPPRTRSFVIYTESESRATLRKVLEDKGIPYGNDAKQVGMNRDPPSLADF